LLNLLPERSVKGLFIRRSEIAVDNAHMFVTPHSLSLRPAFVVLALCLCGLVVQPVSASDHDDHDRARQAVQAGLVLPLPTVLERLQREMPGQVLEVELEQKRGLWVYEIKLLTPAGQLTKVLLDAQTAQVLRVQAREDKSQRRDERLRR
jgi:hypothetical protein